MEMNAFSMKEKTVLITGGGSGLGLAMAKCYTESGATVIITGTRSIDQLEEACRQIGETAFCYRQDVSDTSKTFDFIDMIIRKHGKIDVLVNNAGISCKKPFLEVSQLDLQSVLDVHLLGSYELTKAVVPHMRERGEGSVLFISSMSAYLALTQVTAYAAAKSALLGLVKSLAGELSEFGIRVNAIAPGFIDTPMFHKAVDGDEKRQQQILNHTPMKRYGNPEDIGWAAVYLSSDAARFVNGISLPVDGGCIIGF